LDYGFKAGILNYLRLELCIWEIIIINVGFLLAINEYKNNVQVG